MVKYINSEILKELIDGKWKALANNDLKVGGRGKWDAEINTYLSVLTLIDFLQQTQSNNNLEEKAKAFDEALERARKMLNMILDNELIGFPDQIREIFPQLCENEDEKIRKEIIEYFEHYSGGDNVSIKFPKWIAYLKRQKEASKAIEAVEKIDKYIDEHLANAHDMKDFNPDKKYYRGWDDALGKMAGILQDVYSGEKQKEHKEENLRDFIDNFPYSDKQKEQKPVENSTRTKIISRAANEKQVVLLSESNGNTEINWDTRSLEDAKKLLEHGIVFINERLGTKSAEWSKEDEKNISAIKIALRDAKLEAPEEFESNGVEMTVKDFENAELWLKSLHSSWKPSEKEKIALRTAICILTEENCPKTVANLQAILDVFDDKESRKD